MFRLVVAVALTIIFVAFIMMNTHHVGLSMVVGEPVKIRLIFLLLAAFALGMMSASFYAMVRQVRRRRHATVRAEKPLDLVE